ncbi:hypothetical protein [Mucilaginibacter sp. OK283]|jgi:hypothetical protein|uniref:hypothetical protein n=1 Tax=Mucilaginibacter sp. OK283 TaxID=1881049 RepID=UPI0008C9FB47|nr:hypothetical protein [Mucilaginibacter sp. OK283]SEO51133.1 hypothetical protein SAMN05428947_102626 [Mucilaginibacter sp. OK283]
MENYNPTLLEIVQKEIQDYCAQSLETKGIEDAASNPDLLNRDNNKMMIIAGLESIIDNWLPKLEEKVLEFDGIIKMYTEDGMVNTATPYSTKRSAYVNMVAILKDLLESEESILKKLKRVLKSYEIGFNNGLHNYTEKV